MTASIRIDVNVFDPAALYDAAVAAALPSYGSMGEIGERFGTQKEPNVPACIVELLCEHVLDDAGCEIMSWS